MSDFAVFSVKNPSLLAFNERRQRGPHNLMTNYGIGKIPCNTSMHEIIDGALSNDLRPLFKDKFRQLQRGKTLEKWFLWGDLFGIIANKSIQTKGMWRPWERMSL